MAGLKDIKMKPKLIGLFLIIGLVPLLIVAIMTVNKAETALDHDAIANLEAVQTIKANQIEGYFNERMGDVEVYAFNTAVQTAMSRFVAGFNEGGGPKGATWEWWDTAHGTKLRQYNDIYGYYDLFMISTDGNVVWTACGESDLGANLVSGPLKNSGLAKAYRLGLKGKTFIDFEWYDPSNEPASFVSTAMVDLEGKTVGVLAYQIPLNAINSIMQERAGMGETGETYLVGSDLRMRSNSFLDPTGHTVKASFEGTIAKNGVDTEATKEAFAGREDSRIIDDYNGNPVYSVYSTISLPGGVEWAVIAEKDVAEVEIPVVTIRNATILIGSIIALLIGAIAYYVAVSIAKPIGKIKDVAEVFSTGDLNARVEIDQKDEVGELAKSFRKMANGLREKEAVAESIASGDLSIDIDLASDEDSLGQAMIGVRDRLLNLVNETNSLVKTAVAGRLDKRADHSLFQGEYSNIIKGINRVIDTLVGHIDTIPTPVMIVDKEFNIQYMNKAGVGLGDTTNEQLIGKKCSSYFKTSHCNTDECGCDAAMKNDRTVSAETDAHPGAHNLEIAYTGTPMHNEDGDVIGALEVVADQTEVKNAQRKSEKISKYQAKEVLELSSVLERMADGDLTVNYKMADADDDTADTRESFAGISTAFGRTLEGLNEILGQVNVAVEQVSSGSNQVSSSSQSLSEGATQQAASLEEISSTMTQVGAQTQQNAENSGQANQLVAATGVSAEAGSGRMKDMLGAMDEINASSGQIQKIIKVIDEIAFQTNLLALNAAVEAARAGVHGKGFAVVAEEVRNLAQRSAQAANETTELIEGSVSKAQNGSNIAQETAGALEEIVGQVSKVSDLIGEINAGSMEQNTAIKEVSESLGQVDQVTQANTANAEESAAASEELAGQSTQLKEMLSRFKLTTQQPAHRQNRGLMMDNEGHDRTGVYGIAEQHAGLSGERKGAPRRGLLEGLNTEAVISLDDDDFSSF